MVELLLIVLYFMECLRLNLSSQSEDASTKDLTISKAFSSLLSLVQKCGILMAVHEKITCKLQSAQAFPNWKMLNANFEFLNHRHDRKNKRHSSLDLFSSAFLNLCGIDSVIELLAI